MSKYLNNITRWHFGYWWRISIVESFQDFTISFFFISTLYGYLIIIIIVTGLLRFLCQVCQRKSIRVLVVDVVDYIVSVLFPHIKGASLVVNLYRAPRISICVCAVPTGHTALPMPPEFINGRRTTTTAHPPRETRVKGRLFDKKGPEFKFMRERECMFYC